jgi:hypothetical protein
MNDQGKVLAVTCDLALIITISDTSKNQPKWIDTDDQINLSRLIVYLGTIFSCKVDTWSVKSVAWRRETGPILYLKFKNDVDVCLTYA